MENTLFFWVLPAIFVVFAAMFVTMGRIDRGNDSARWAATAFIIGSIGVLIDSGRSVSPVWVFALTVPMHWVVVFCVVQAFMLRHGQGISKHLIWTVFGVGNTINLLAIFVLHSPAIRVPNTATVAMLLILLAVPALVRNAHTSMDRVTAILVSAAAATYAIRIVVYFAANQLPTYAADTMHSVYARTYFLATGIIALAVGMHLVLSITWDVIRNFRDAALLDPLTGLLNRRGLDQLVDADATRFGAAIMIDLEHFKRVNDRHGHAAGDQLLRDAATSIAGAVRPYGIAVRIGGEEFLVLVDRTHAEGAAVFARHLREGIAVRSVAATKASSVTASAGVAVFDLHESMQAAISRADAALYEAKRPGRDRIAIATNIDLHLNAA